MDPAVVEPLAQSRALWEQVQGMAWRERVVFVESHWTDIARACAASFRFADWWDARGSSPWGAERRRQAWKDFRLWRASVDGLDVRQELTLAPPTPTSAVIEMLLLPGDTLRIALTDRAGTRYASAGETFLAEAIRLQKSDQDGLYTFYEGGVFRDARPLVSLLATSARRWSELLLDRGLLWAGDGVASLGQKLSESPPSALHLVVQGPLTVVPWALLRASREEFLWGERFELTRVPSLLPYVPPLPDGVSGVAMESVTLQAQRDVRSFLNVIARSRVARVAGHHRFRDEDPRRSWVKADGYGGPRLEVGSILDALPLEAPWRNRFVLLSLCESAERLRTLVLTDHVEVAHAFLVAGSEQVLASPLRLTRASGALFDEVTRELVSDPSRRLSIAVHSVLHERLVRWREILGRDTVPSESEAIELCDAAGLLVEARLPAPTERTP